MTSPVLSGNHHIGGDDPEDTKNISQITANAMFCSKTIMISHLDFILNHFNGLRHGKAEASTS